MYFDGEGYVYSNFKIPFFPIFQFELSEKNYSEFFEQVMPIHMKKATYSAIPKCAFRRVWVGQVFEIHGVENSNCSTMI